MKKLIITFLVVLVIALVACNKDKFQTKPQIAIKSYNTKVVEVNKELLIKVSYTDKEGDLAGGTFVSIPIRVNKNSLPSTALAADTVKSLLDPDFPNIDKGDLQFKMRHDELDKGNNRKENDTLFFRFVLVDKANHTSDTINTDKIVVIKK